MAEVGSVVVVEEAEVGLVEWGLAEADWVAEEAEDSAEAGQGVLGSEVVGSAEVEEVEEAGQGVLDSAEGDSAEGDSAEERKTRCRRLHLRHLHLRRRAHHLQVHRRQRTQTGRPTSCARTLRR